MGWNVYSTGWNVHSMGWNVHSMGWNIKPSRLYDETKPIHPLILHKQILNFVRHTPDLHKNRYLCPVKLLTEAASYQQFCKMLQE